MTTKLPKTKFYTKASYLLSRHMQLDDLDELVNEYDITQEEINSFKENHKKGKMVSSALFQSKEQKEMTYNILDVKFVEKHPNLVVFRRGENITFYEYRNGVYINLHDIEMENLVDDIMEEFMLLDYRTKRKYVKDTVARIGSLLCRTPKKHFVDDDIYKEKFYLNLKNGLLDPSTYTLYPHTPTYFSTVQVPFDYNKEAQAPMFMDFLDKVSGKNESTKQMIQDMFGYGLSDGNKQHKVFYLYGETARNGKSTTAKILCGLIGMGNVSTLSLSQMAGENSTVLTSIINKQINFSDELSNKYIDSSRLTAMSSEGMIEINPKYKHAFMYRVKAKFIVACNDLPEFQDGQGMKHRMISIPFRVQIPITERIARYDEVLLEKEGSGILNWAIDGAKKLQASGIFTINDESREDIMDNIYSSNSVYAFMDEYYDFSPHYMDFISTKEMYGSVGHKDNLPTMYRKFCVDTGVKPKSLKKFEKEVSRFCNELGKIQSKRHQNMRGYEGLREKDYEEKTGASLLTNTKTNEDF